MFASIRQLFKPPAFDDEEQRRSASLLYNFLMSLLAVVLTASPILILLSEPTTLVANFVLSSLFAVCIIGLLVLTRRGKLQLANTLLLVLLMAMFTAMMAVFGPTGSNASTFILGIILSGLLLGEQAVIPTGIVSSLILVAIYNLRPISNPRLDMVDLFLLIIMYMLAAVLLRFAVRSLRVALESAHQNESALAKSNQELQTMRAMLEERVSQRSRDLSVSIEVSRRLSTILDPQQLVGQVVEQVRSAFNFYHVHIYLFDEKQETLHMVGGTGEAGQAMLAAGHKLVRGRGLVGRAAEDNEVVLVPDVSHDQNWLPNPLLPDTKAEMAVPINVGNHVLGVLDIQHNVTNGLQENDVMLLQSLANQVAVALQNANLYSQAQQQAERETLLNSISQRIQQTTSVENVLQVAAEELGRALGTTRATVQLANPARPNNGRSLER